MSVFIPNISTLSSLFSKIISKPFFKIDMPIKKIYFTTLEYISLSFIVWYAIFKTKANPLYIFILLAGTSLYIPKIINLKKIIKENEYGHIIGMLYISLTFIFVYYMIHFLNNNYNYYINI